MARPRTVAVATQLVQARWTTIRVRRPNDGRISLIDPDARDGDARARSGLVGCNALAAVETETHPITGKALRVRASTSSGCSR